METTETTDFLLMAGQSAEAMAHQNDAGWPAWLLLLALFILLIKIVAAIKVITWFRMAMRIDLEGINL